MEPAGNAVEEETVIKKWMSNRQTQFEKRKENMQKQLNKAELGKKLFMWDGQLDQKGRTPRKNNFCVLYSRREIEQDCVDIILPYFLLSSLFCHFSLPLSTFSWNFIFWPTLWCDAMKIQSLHRIISGWKREKFSGERATDFWRQLNISVLQKKFQLKVITLYIKQI